MIALVAPWCPNCVRLMEDARHGELPYNLFAIPTEPANDTDRLRIAEACFAETDEEKAFFHSRSKLPKRTLTFEQIEFINRVQLETLHIIFAYAKRFQSDPPKGFPTIYTAYSDGFWAGSGYVSDLYRKHVKRSAKSELRPNFINTATLAQMMETSQNKKTYRLKNSETRFRLLPRSDTLTAMCSAPPNGFEADFQITVDGKTFVGLTVGNSYLNIASTGRYVDLNDVAEA
ncbi:hypothetical protein J5J10_12260 [Ciceribacter sp. L1K23]|uniref:hypothetical protein n=1 Tax=Ciceribacter sp. L1K23 TaxID=2820276 RepID=UPI001B814D09|nr:hypothetical protein [Ciceribacter sp. L1K23]MBR0556454.1 hypothetical protein [Ciceribacter sp. L1K23]